MENKGDTGLTEQEHDAVLGLLKMKTEPYEEVAKILQEDVSASSPIEKNGDGGILREPLEASESMLSRGNVKSDASSIGESTRTALGDIIQFRKGRWSEEEVTRLKEAINMLGDKDWVAVSRIVLSRTGTQCRDKWIHYSNSMKKETRTQEAEEMK